MHADGEFSSVKFSESGSKRTTTQIRFQFTAQPGQPYALEFRASLATGNWEALTNIAAQPITVDVTFRDSITENGHFYRLKNIAR